MPFPAGESVVSRSSVGLALSAGRASESTLPRFPRWSAGWLLVG